MSCDMYIASILKLGPSSHFMENSGGKYQYNMIPAIISKNFHRNVTEIYLPLSVKIDSSKGNLNQNQFFA